MLLPRSPDVAGRQLRPARLADRPREARRPLPAAGARQGAVARRARAARPGPGRRDAARDPRPGTRRAGPPHRRRDPPRELLQPLRDGARRRRRRQPGHRAGPLRAPEPGAAHRRPDPPAAPGAGPRPGVPARPHRPAGEDDRARAVHDEPAGAERPLPGPRVGRDGLRRGGQRRDQGPVRGRRGRRPDRRALPAGPPGRRPRLRAGRAEPRAGRRHRDDRGAPVLRLRGDHPRAPVGLLVPARAGRLPGGPDLDRDRAVRARPRRAGRPVRQDDHPRRDRPVDAGGRDAPRWSPPGCGGRTRTGRRSGW